MKYGDIAVIEFKAGHLMPPDSDFTGELCIVSSVGSGMAHVWCRDWIHRRRILWQGQLTVIDHIDKKDMQNLELYKL